VSLLLVAFWTAAAFVCVTVALTVSVRISSGVARRRLGRYRDVVGGHLFAYVADTREDRPPPPHGRFQQRVLRRDLVALMPSVKGEAAERVADLFVGYGLEEVARRDLGSRDSLTRIRAAEALGVMRVADAKPWLEEQLAHHDPLLRLACARALADLGAVDAMPAVMLALNQVGAQTGDVEEVLLAFGPGGVPFLRRLLVMGSRSERRLAVVTLGHIGSHVALGDLRAALSDGDDELVASAARALGELGDSSITDSLVELLGGARPWFVRVAAASALGALEAPAAAPALTDALNAEEWDLRNAAARSLVLLDDKGLTAVVAAGDSLSDQGFAHFAGLLDVAGRLDAIVGGAADGDHDRDRFVRRASEVGVCARLEGLAAGSKHVNRYAAGVLASAGAGATG
jgi:HEAT repeat protein